MSTMQKEYPPIVVDTLPNWIHHFKLLKERLGYSPNARPYGSGVRFFPGNGTEYQKIRRYLKEIATTEDFKWYALHRDQMVKIAVRGLPVNTAPEAVMEGLRELGYVPVYARQLHAINGRPGIFQVILRRTRNLCPSIWEVTELLNMPGIQIELWRSNRRTKNNNYQACFHSPNHCDHISEYMRCEEINPVVEIPSTEPTKSYDGGDLQLSNLVYPITNTNASHERAEIATSTRLIGLSVNSMEPQSIEETHGSILSTTTENILNANKLPTSSLKRKRGRGKRRDAPPTTQMSSTIPISTTNTSVVPSTIIPTFTETFTSDIIKEYVPDPVEEKAWQYACENMYNIFDAIRTSNIFNKKIVEIAFLAAYNIATYRAHENSNLSKLAYTNTEPENDPSTHTSYNIKDRNPVVNAVCANAQENIMKLKEIVFNDLGAIHIHDACCLAHFRLKLYRTYENREKSEKRALSMYNLATELFAYYRNKDIVENTK